MKRGRRKQSRTDKGVNNTTKDKSSSKPNTIGTDEKITKQKPVETMVGEEEIKNMSIPQFKDSELKVVADSTVIDQKTGGVDGAHLKSNHHDSISNISKDVQHENLDSIGDLLIDEPLINYDPNLWRHARILVPVDVQALVVNDDTDSRDEFTSRLTKGSSGGESLATPEADLTPRISMWSGKVNQHNMNGVWMTDPDGSAGGGSHAQWGDDGWGDRKLAYCQRFWPETTSVLKQEEKETITFYTAGNKNAYESTKDVWICVQPESEEDEEGDENVEGSSNWADLESRLHSYCIDCHHYWDASSSLSSCPKCSSNNLETINKAPDPFSTKTENLQAGIHLHWAMPDSLMHGEPLDEEEDVGYMELTDLVCIDCGNRWNVSGVTDCSDCNSANVKTAKEVAEQDIEIPNESDSERNKGWHELYEFPQLPDRWLVVRTWPKIETFQGPSPVTSPSGYFWSKWNHAAWVVESDTLNVVPLPSWNLGPSYPVPSPPSQDMTAVGPATGDPTWTVTYDNAKGRFTFHDTPHNIRGPLNYFVAGWYSDKNQDPLWSSSHTLQTDWWKKMDNLNWSVDKQHIEEYVNAAMEENGVPWYLYTQIIASLDDVATGVKGEVSVDESTTPIYDDDVDVVIDDSLPELIPDVIDKEIITSLNPKSPVNTMPTNEEILSELNHDDKGGDYL